MNDAKQKIDVVNSISELSTDRFVGKTAVVIDVLRATSVMVTALSYGAKKVVPVLSKEEALAYQEHNPEELVILAGERNSDPIEGFDLGNSPVDLIPDVIKEATLVMTTTNGTKTIRKAEGAFCLYIASFLNALATAEALKEEKDVVLIASGTNGLYSIEDVLCAGYLVRLLKQNSQKVLLTDAAIAACNLYNSNVADFPGIALQGKHYNILKQKGRERDLHFCFQRNLYPVVCKLTTGFIKKV